MLYGTAPYGKNWIHNQRPACNILKSYVEVRYCTVRYSTILRSKTENFTSTGTGTVPGTVLWNWIKSERINTVLRTYGTVQVHSSICFFLGRSGNSKEIPDLPEIQIQNGYRTYNVQVPILRYRTDLLKFTIYIFCPEMF